MEPEDPLKRSLAPTTGRCLETHEPAPPFTPSVSTIYRNTVFTVMRLVPLQMQPGRTDQPQQQTYHTQAYHVYATRLLMSLHVSLCLYTSPYVSTRLRMSLRVSLVLYVSPYISTCLLMSLHVSLYNIVIYRPLLEKTGSVDWGKNCTLP
jgi:hypothetical protein